MGSIQGPLMFAKLPYFLEVVALGAASAARTSKLPEGT